ncbi:MAG: DUF3800 domain-containing protein [bacterium]
MNKIYCYVDESGQDTEGKLFIVAVIITKSERDEIIKELENIEKISNKGTRKWFRTNKERRKFYIKGILANKLFEGKIFYSKYEDTKAYVDLTILTTAKTIIHKTKDVYKATVLVDGLKKTERFKFASGLRKLNIRVRKVRGINDQSDIIIRLADSIAGFTRDYLEYDKEMTELYKIATEKNMIKEI